MERDSGEKMYFTNEIVMNEYTMREIAFGMRRILLRRIPFNQDLSGVSVFCEKSPETVSVRAWASAGCASLPEAEGVSGVSELLFEALPELFDETLSEAGR